MDKTSTHNVTVAKDKVSYAGKELSLQYIECFAFRDTIYGMDTLCHILYLIFGVRIGPNIV